MLEALCENVYLCGYPNLLVANIENNNDDDDDDDDDDDGDGGGDGDDDPCKNALTAPEPLLASARSFSNISTILVLKNT